MPNAPPAAALGAQSDSYSLSWGGKVDINRCLTFTLSGTVTYTTAKAQVYSGGIVHTDYMILSPTVSKPKLVVTVKSWSSYSGCSGTATLTKIKMIQHWSGYSCSFNPSFSVGYPFAVGVSFWPSCSDRTQAKYSSTYSATASTFTQNNSSAYVKYENVVGVDHAPTAPCYAAFVDATAYVGAESDSYSGTSKKVCLTPTW